MGNSCHSISRMTPLKPPQTIRASLKHSAGRPSPSDCPSIISSFCTASHRPSHHLDLNGQSSNRFTRLFHPSKIHSRRLFSASSLQPSSSLSLTQRRPAYAFLRLATIYSFCGQHSGPAASLTSPLVNGHVCPLEAPGSTESSRQGLGFFSPWLDTTFLCLANERSASLCATLPVGRISRKDEPITGPTRQTTYSPDIRHPKLSCIHVLYSSTYDVVYILI
jgi:hypothetical protein